ncbi:hypothetical protein C0989_000342 [Termitomyces sp. Mn162]|nr:hypothetical protein C0989_000342 [Termitomyces sp. Mn162]
MPVPYVAAIRSVLDTYPPSKGLFREILQNSKDTKATKQIFVLDHRTPAHDSVFMIVISSLYPIFGMRRKKQTHRKSLFLLQPLCSYRVPRKIGKFGMGFRPTFHISDTPQVLSASTLAILDPLNNNDVQINLDTAEKRASIIDPFALRLFQPTDPTVFQGTVDEIRISLLFLTNVSSIEIFKLGTNTSRKIINHPFAEHYPKRHLRPFMHHLKVTIEVNHAVLQHWRILRTSFPPNIASSELSNRLGFDATQHKHPSNTINRTRAIPPEPTIGRLFTYLPLPLLTQFSNHIHGLFALTPSRGPPRNARTWHHLPVRPFHSTPRPRPHQPPHPQHLHRMEQTPVRRVPPQDMDVPPVHAHRHTLRTPDPERLRRLAAPAGCRPARRQRGLGKVFSNTSSIISSSPNAASGRSLDPPAGFVSWRTSLLRETGRGMGCYPQIPPLDGEPRVHHLPTHHLTPKRPRRTRSSTVHVLLDRSVYDLFKTRDGDDSAIALAHIDPRLADLLLLNGPRILNVDVLSPPIVLGYLQTHLELLNVVPRPHVEHATHRLGIQILALDARLAPVSAAKSTLPSARSPCSRRETGSDGYIRVCVFDMIRRVFRPDLVRSFIADEETARALVSHGSSCELRRGQSEDRRRKLSALPIYASHPLTSTRGRIPIPDGCAVFGVRLTDLLFLPVLVDTIILDSPQSGMSAVLIRAVDPDTRGILSDLDVLRLCLTHFATQPIRPSTSAILDRLAELREGDKSTRVVVTKACRLLSLLSDEDISDANHRSRVFVPDTSCTLRPVHSVLYNDIGERAVLVSLGDDEYLAHDMINESLARSLHMDRLGLKFVDLGPQATWDRYGRGTGDYDSE